MRKLNSTPERRYPEKTRERHRYADQTAVSEALRELRDSQGFYNSDLISALLDQLSGFIDSPISYDGRTKRGKELNEALQAIRDARRTVAEYFRNHRPDA